MKILYIAFKDFSKLHFGASKKVVSECKAFEQYGHEVTLIGREKSDIVFIKMDGRTKKMAEHKQYPIGKLELLLDKQHQISDILKYISDKSFDYCYIRFDLCSKNFMRLLRDLKKVCKRIDIEIPTFPYDKEYVGKLNKIRLAIDRHYGKQLHKYVSQIISFYDIPGNSFNNVPVLRVPNGFDFDEIAIVKNDTVPKDIHIAAVSSMRIWHGYERMIEGMHSYYSSGGQRNVVLHLVGDGREGVKYKELVRKYNLDSHVMFHGAMHGDELDNLLENCTLGIDSLGRHRTGISVLSSLKSREYGAKGLPFINSCDIDIVDDDFEFFLKVPADESPINLDDIIRFYDKCFAAGSRITVAKKVRKYIEQKSGMRTVAGRILDSLDTSR